MKKIVLVAFDQFTDIDLFLMWDILGRNTSDWRVRIVGANPTLSSAHGLTVHPHGPLSETRDADAVLFVSGRQGIPTALNNPAFLPSLALDPSRQHIGAICAGVYILDRLGLIPTGQVSTHPEAKDGLLQRGLQVLEQPLVCRGKVATAGGCLAAIYLLGWLVESMFDADKRRETLSPVLPSGQQEIYEDLIEFSIRQGREHGNECVRVSV